MEECVSRRIVLKTSVDRKTGGDFGVVVVPRVFLGAVRELEVLDVYGVWRDEDSWLAVMLEEEGKEERRAGARVKLNICCCCWCERWDLALIRMPYPACRNVRVCKKKGQK